MILSIDDFFNALNLLLRLFIVCYLIRRYVAPYIKQALKNEKSEKEILAQSYIELKKECQNIQDLIDQDEKFFERMQQKMKFWKHAVEKAELQEQEECLRREKEIENNAQARRNNIEHRRLILNEVPGLIDQTAQDLNEMFQKDAELSKKYLAQVLKALDE